MRFAFSDDQLAFRDAFGDLLTKQCTPADLRAAWANETGRVPGLWAAIVEMGVTGMLLAEGDGGLGLSMVDLVLLLEESGRHALPEPIVETAAFGAPLERDPALCVAAGHELVPWADTADVVYTGAGRVAGADASLTPHASVDASRRLFEVSGPFTGADMTAAFVRGVVGFAAQQCGLADRMIELTVAYVKERTQFGAPIGSFQAVKHHLANARLTLEFARPLVYRAAVTLDAAHASMAKLKGDEAALTTARAALQCHGAIGYTTEYDLHLYMKRSWALARSWGDRRHHIGIVAGATRRGSS